MMPRLGGRTHSQRTLQLVQLFEDPTKKEQNNNTGSSIFIFFLFILA